MSVKRRTLKGWKQHADDWRQVKQTLRETLTRASTRLLRQSFRHLRHIVKTYQVRDIVARRIVRNTFLTLRKIQLVRLAERAARAKAQFGKWRKRTGVGVAGRWVKVFYELWLLGSAYQACVTFCRRAKAAENLRRRVRTRQNLTLVTAFFDYWLRFARIHRAVRDRQQARLRKILIRATQCWKFRVAAGLWKKSLKSLADHHHIHRGTAHAFHKLAHSLANSRFCKTALAAATHHSNSKAKESVLDQLIANARYTTRSRELLILAYKFRTRRLQQQGMIRVMENADRRLREKALQRRAAVGWIERRMYWGVKQFGAVVKYAALREDLHTKQSIVEKMRSRSTSLTALRVWRRTMKARLTAQSLTATRALQSTHTFFTRWINHHRHTTESMRLLSIGNKWHRQRALKKTLRRWSVRSLRKIAGYQMADRFKASARLRRWHEWAKARHHHSLAMWVAARQWEKTGKRRVVTNLVRRVEQGKGEKYLVSMWNARRGGNAHYGECASFLRSCWRSWLFVMKLGAAELRMTGVATMHFSAKLLLRAWMGWKSYLREVDGVRRCLKLWIQFSERGVGAGKWRRRFGKRMALRRLVMNVAVRKKLKQAAAWFILGAKKRCFMAFKRAVELVRVGVAEQRERKRVVLRKLKIKVLKDKLGNAQWRRALTRRVWKAWSRLEREMDEVASSWRRRRVLGGVFALFKELEKRGRRERWINKLVGKGRDEGEGAAEAGEGGMFSPSMKERKGGTGRKGYGHDKV